MLKRISADNDDDEIAAAGDCIARARQLAPLIEAHAAETEAARGIAPAVLAALHEARLFRMLMPQSCDGMELEPATYVQAIEEIAKADASTAWCVAQGSGCSMTAAYLAPNVARDVFGDPGAVLAWGPTDGKQRAVAVEGGYRVSGTWHFASGLGHATWVGGHCVIVEPDGSLRPGDDGKPLDRTMLMPKSSVTVTDVWRVVGLKGTGSNTFSCTDVFVPEAYTLTRESAQDRRASGPLYRFTTYQLYGMGFAGHRARHRAPLARCLHGAGDGKDALSAGQGAARERRDPVAGGAGRSQAQRVARAAAADLARAVGDGGERRRSLARAARRRCGSPACTRRTRPRTWSTRSIMRPARPRSSRATRSSAGSATCTP